MYVYTSAAPVKVPRQYGSPVAWLKLWSECHLSWMDFDSSSRGLGGGGFGWEASTGGSEASPGLGSGLVKRQLLACHFWGTHPEVTSHPSRLQTGKSPEGSGRAHGTLAAAGSWPLLLQPRLGQAGFWYFIFQGYKWVRQRYPPGTGEVVGHQTVHNIAVASLVIAVASKAAS